MKIGTYLDYASLLPLMALTTGLLFVSNWQDGIIFMRAEGLVWASSHWLSLLGVVAVTWGLLVLDKWKGIFLNVLAMFNVASLHEIFFARLFYVHDLQTFVGTWLTFGISLVGLFATVWKGTAWQKAGLGFVGTFLPLYWVGIGQWYQPTVLLSGGFNEPWASQVLPNLSEIFSWAFPSFIMLFSRLYLY